MSEKNKSIEVIEIALARLTAIRDSNKLAKKTLESDGSPMTLESELKVIHSLAASAVEILHEHLDEFYDD